MKPRHIVRSFVLVIALSVMGALTIAKVVAEPPQERNFFGTVLSVEKDLLVVSTEGAVVDVPISGNTRVRLPLKRHAELADLTEGDLVGISLNTEKGVLVADKVILIPEKTRFRHVPGVVIMISDTHIAVQPPGDTAGPATFILSSTTKINFHSGTGKLVEGAYVIVVAVRDSATGELTSDALEVHVVRHRLGGAIKANGKQAKASAPANRAEIQGVFEGVDDDGNWIISGTKVIMDVGTEIEAGLVVGDLVEIEGELKSNGFLLARHVEIEHEDRQVSNRIRLEGVYEGQDDDGNWIIDGIKLAVDGSTDTDGLPHEEQRVKVKALVREDGSILAREIENKGNVKKHQGKSRGVELTGIFQGINDDGRWIVNGVNVAVNALTRLEGTMAVGSHIEVKARLLGDGVLVASEIEGDGKHVRKSKKEVEIRGTIEHVEEGGTLVIDGFRIAISALTELDTEPKQGAFVEVKALIQDDGTLVAREVEHTNRDETSGARPSTATFEGTIESVSEDDILIVNGISVAISTLSDIKGDLREGAFIKIHGVLQSDGSVLAHKIKGEGHKVARNRGEFKVTSAIHDVETDGDGNVVAMIVNGLRIWIEALTDIEVALVKGTFVEIKGLLSGGELVAGKVEQEEPDDEDAGTTEIRIEGIVESAEPAEDNRTISIKVGGVEVNIGPLTDVRGGLEAGAAVEIKGIVREGIILVRRVESEERKPEEAKAQKFRVEGLVMAVEVDDSGDIVSIIVDGQQITVNSSTRVEDMPELGRNVEIRGTISDRELIASRIKERRQRVDADDGNEKDDDSKKGSSKRKGRK